MLTGKLGIFEIWMCCSRDGWETMQLSASQLRRSGECGEDGTSTQLSGNRFHRRTHHPCHYFFIVIVTIILIPIIIIIKSNHLAERRMLRGPWGEETYYGGLCSTPLSSCQARTNFSQPLELYTPRLYLHVKHAHKGGFP